MPFIVVLQGLPLCISVAGDRGIIALLPIPSSAS
jgi:hypothetical protein